MSNQCETLIPSKLSYITLLSHQTNKTKLKLTIEFTASIYDNKINYL